MVSSPLYSLTCDCLDLSFFFHLSQGDPDFGHSCWEIILQGSVTFLHIHLGKEFWKMDLESPPKQRAAMLTAH